MKRDGRSEAGKVPFTIQIESGDWGGRGSVRAGAEAGKSSRGGAEKKEKTGVAQGVLWAGKVERRQNI